MNSVTDHRVEVYRARSRSPLAIIAILLSLVVAVTAIMAGLGTRWDLWSFRWGSFILRWSVIGACFTTLVSLWAAWHTFPIRSQNRGFPLALLALAVSALLIGVPLKWYSGAGESPPIQDLTTDTVNPPKFYSLEQDPSKNESTLFYRDELDTQLRNKAYPEIDSLTVSVPKRECMKLALKLVRRKGWNLRLANWRKGKIEATTRTLWFGLRTDVAIRLKRKGREKYVVDMRSVSRHTKGYAGTNTRLIKNYLKDLRKMTKKD